jgi:hypothetical protein
MFGRVTTRQALQLSLIGVGLGAIPFGLGIVLGFAAFVVTPILVPLLAIGAGVILARIAPRSPWSATALSATATAATYAVPFLILAVVNRSFHLGSTLIGALYCGALGVIAWVLLTLGAWFGGAWRRQRTPEPQS